MTVRGLIGERLPRRALAAVLSLTGYACASAPPDSTRRVPRRETQSHQRQGDSYAPLDKLTPEQQQIFATYDAPLYTASSGGIPFIDFGGRYLVSGVTYDPSVLSGKSAADIADALTDPATPISQGAVGTANTFTATICSLTSGQPASVCNDPTIREIAARLKP